MPSRQEKTYRKIILKPLKVQGNQKEVQRSRAQENKNVSWKFVTPLSNFTGLQQEWNGIEIRVDGFIDVYGSIDGKQPNAQKKKRQRVYA